MVSNGMGENDVRSLIVQVIIMCGLMGQVRMIYDL